MTGKVSVIVFLFFLCIVTNVSAWKKLLGEHICQKEISELTPVETWELKNKTVRTYKWCLNVPPRCSEYRVRPVNESKIIMINNTRTIEVCCDGFEEHHGLCLSSCGSCGNGFCRHGICECHQGWQGMHCETPLTKNDTKNIEDVFLEKSYSVLNQTLRTEEPTSTTSDSDETRLVSSTLVTDISTPTRASTEKATVSSRSTQISTSLSTNTVKDAISTSSIVGFSTFFDTSTEKSTVSSRSTQISTPQSTSSEKGMVTTSLTKSSTTLNTNTEKESTLEISTKTIPFTLTKISTTDDPLGFFTPTHQKTSFSQSTNDDNSFNTIITKPSSSIFTTSTSFSHSKESTPKSQFTEAGNDGDIDYRELGGKSIELDSSELFNSEEIVVSSTIRPSVQAESSETLLKSLSSDEDQSKKYKSVFLANIIDRSDVRKHHTVQGDVSDHHDVTEQDPTGKNLIYSVCAASITTGIILVVVIVFVALRKNKKRMGKDEEKKDVATVAVYTTSIFHTPLPEPPSFENPSYITATDRNSWKNPIESIEVRDILPYPSRDCKTEFKTYLYDHPPSTGSYRASSDIDALSQYNNSRKLSFTGTTVLDPVYDEIPGNEEEYSVPRKSYRPVSREEDNFNLYMNTCKSTKF